MKNSLRHRARGSLLLYAASALVFMVPAGSPGIVVAEKPSGRGVRAVQTGSTGEGAVTHGPGSLKLSCSPRGEWFSLVPSWSKGESLISGGGFFLIVRTSGGNPRLLGVDREKTSARRALFSSGKRYEGCPSGNRKPSPDPDDDGDGLVDEDRLDGVDNDGDGRIDEDFASIGDEMCVIEYTADTTAGLYRFLFHQEMYGWSLPNISNIIFLSVRVKNLSERSVESLNVGAFFEAEGPLTCYERSIESVYRGRERKAGAMVCLDDEGKGLGMILFQGFEGSSGAPTMGIAGKASELVALPSPAAGASFEVGGSRDEAEHLASKKIEEGDEALVYGLGPVVDGLAPGGEVRFDIALFAAGIGEDVENILVDAYKTFYGDGENPLLPPPVALTRRVLWGSYKRLPGGEDAVLVTVDESVSEGVTPERISLLSSIPADRIEYVRSQDGALEFILKGGIPDKLVDETGRVSIKGRLDGGGIFELLLRPEAPENGGGRSKAAGDLAGTYWNVPGLLEQDLLKVSPNPFRDAVSIYYEVPSTVVGASGDELVNTEQLETSVRVYNIRGRQVEVLVDEVLGPGRYSTRWDASDEKGTPVASGVYYVRLQIGKRHVIKRAILLR